MTENTGYSTVMHRMHTKGAKEYHGLNMLSGSVSEFMAAWSKEFGSWDSLSDEFMQATENYLKAIDKEMGRDV